MNVLLRWLCTSLLLVNAVCYAAGTQDCSQPCIIVECAPPQESELYRVNNGGQLEVLAPVAFTIRIVSVKDALQSGCEVSIPATVKVVAIYRGDTAELSGLTEAEFNVLLCGGNTLRDIDDRFQALTGARVAVFERPRQDNRLVLDDSPCVSTWISEGHDHLNVFRYLESQYTPAWHAWQD